MYLYNFDILRLKIALFIMWYILEIIDFDITNWVKEFNCDMEKDLLKWKDWNVVEINKN